jgi:hypothetical protein
MAAWFVFDFPAMPQSSPDHGGAPPTVSYSWCNGWEVGPDSETTYDSNAARGDGWYLLDPTQC